MTRTYIVANIGSCPLDITSLSSTNSDFVVTSPYSIPWYDLDPYYYIVIQVTFTAPVAGSGTQTSTISIDNTDNTTFNFNVSAEMFNENIPGPGGITADFRLWLKSTRGITQNASKVSFWQDLGTNDKSAEQPVSANQPTYLDEVNSNINFNPVIKFENDGLGLEQYLYNSNNGFYSQDIFIVMIPDVNMTSSSSRNTIFSGTFSGLAGDITGVGFGDNTSRFTSEVLSYNQNIAAPLGLYNGVADEVTISYSKAGIINVRNNITASAQEIAYNSGLVSSNTINDIPYLNVGYTDLVAPFTVYGSKYWIGRNFDIQGSLNGRVAEIFTFAERLTNANRQKVESYLAIKYGITLGSSNEAEKDYVNSFDTKIWDITVNSSYNYNVAGIGRDSISDLNQKQSKTINLINDVTIGLGGLYTKNSLNTNEFNKDGDFLVWGNNNGAFSGSNTNQITIASGLTTLLTRMDRKWKVVETKATGSNGVETVYIGIPDSAFTGFSKTPDEEYVLIVADNENFANDAIIDVIPLKINVDITGSPILDKDGNQVYKTWYNFDNTKYFTFGKASRLSDNHSVTIGTGDYLVGEYELNLNVDSFTISSWVKCSANSSIRTIMSKGEKLQLRLNASGNVEVMIDDSVTPKFVSNMVVDDGKWHQLTFVYDSGTILLYVDGILDKSIQDVVHPSPNYNHYAIGSVYINKDNVINPLLGKIDEVYVWDLALSENQIRFLMNQEIERIDNSGTDYVNGKVLPYASSNNETANIPWSNLRVYYDFNSFYGSTVEGLTDDRFFIRLRYLNKNKSVVDSQTIPAPYITVVDDGNWDDESTWLNGSENILPNGIGLDGSKINWNIVETLHNINSGDRDIKLLALINSSGTLKIADPNEDLDETNSGQGLTITHYLELDGVIDLVGESQLVQSEGSIIDADSGGYIERDQQGTANGFNYNYWSSSVGPITGNSATRGIGVTSANSNYTIEEVLNDGTISDLYQSLIFSTNPNGSGTVPPPGLPRTISSEWLYTFYGAENDYYAWQKIVESSVLMAGEGYTMKGTSGNVSIATQQNYVYKGLPYNGDITLELDNTSVEVNRLIGNPYPSAIDATEFILDNISEAEGGNNPNGTVFNGALYFWDHFGDANSHYLSDYVGGYAVRNLLGGVAAISDDNRINNTSLNGGPASGTKIPGQFIPVNQGFFVSTKLEGMPNGAGSNITSVDGGNIVFKNSQRVFERENIASSVFMRTSQVPEPDSQYQTNSNSIIRLMYDSPSGYHRQIAIGLANTATNGFDLGYDAYLADINNEDMYWVFNEGKFVIQGVNNFNVTQEFPLGVVVNQSGIITIKIDSLENIDTNTTIYIKDSITNETFDLSASNFTAFLDPGTYEERFSLVFQSLDSNLLNVNDNQLSDDLIFYSSNDAELMVRLSDSIEVINGLLLNYLGQKVLTLDINSSTANIPLNVNAGIYIVKLNTSMGILSKKIIVD